MKKEKISALLVHRQPDPWRSLKLALEGQSIKTSRARTCREVSRRLERASPPHLVFTDTTLSDGTWAEVLSLAAKAPAAVNVVVVSRLVDVKLYVEAIERGAWDFIAPPFEAADLAYVVRCAWGNVLSRRDAQGRLERSRALVSPLLHPST